MEKDITKEIFPSIFKMLPHCLTTTEEKNHHHRKQRDRNIDESIREICQILHKLIVVLTQLETQQLFNEESLIVGSIVPDLMP